MFTEQVKGQVCVVHCSINACVFISFTWQMLVNSDVLQTIAFHARLFSYLGVLFFQAFSFSFIHTEVYGQTVYHIYICILAGLKCNFFLFNDGQSTVTPMEMLEKKLQATAGNLLHIALLLIR